MTITISPLALTFVAGFAGGVVGGVLLVAVAIYRATKDE